MYFASTIKISRLTEYGLYKKEKKHTFKVFVMGTGLIKLLSTEMEEDCEQKSFGDRLRVLSDVLGLRHLLDTQAQMASPHCVCQPGVQVVHTEESSG